MVIFYSSCRELIQMLVLLATLYFFLFNFFMCVGLSPACMSLPLACLVTKEARRVESLGTGITRDCELPDVGELGSSTRAESSLDS